MLSKTLMILTHLGRSLWVRVVVIAVFALLAAALAPLLGPVLPEPVTDRLGEDAVRPVLTILASTMLAVTTFSLNVMVSAYRAASGQATPRAYRILMEDTTTQTVLATFVGAFIFSLAAIVLYRAGLYSPAASVVLFVFTVGVVALIILAILRWIGHLSQLGSMDHTLYAITTRTRTSLAARAARPALGGVPIEGGHPPPAGAQAVPAPRSGYVQFIDIVRLDAAMREGGGEAIVAAPPGAFIVKGHPLAHVLGDCGGAPERLAGYFTLADQRSFDQDARLGLVILSEIAERALSPGVNDPGTAIDVIHRSLALLWETGAPEEGAADVSYPNVRVPEVTAWDLVSDAFGPVARDGAGTVMVARELDAALDRLSAHHDADLADAAERMRREARRYTADALTEAERDALESGLSPFP